MAQDKNIVARPPATAIESVQFNLFSKFLANDKSTVSNTIEIWEKIPKYFFTPKQIKELRPEKGQPDPFKWSYMENGQEFSVIIQPALIEQEDGTFKAFFPSSTEELVEEALKKILTEQNWGIHDPSKAETWVRFSLSMIYKKLKAMGKGRNRLKIKHAIAVMSRTVITLYQGKKEIWTGNILQDLVTVEREKYLKDTNAYHIARLPLFISHAINHLETRQFNYERLMSCNEQLSRWIYKRLINRFKQASFITNYHFMYSDLKQSGLLQQSTERDNRKKALKSLNELQEKGVIISYVSEEKNEGRKVVDVKYIVHPSRDFVMEQKAANKRMTDNHQIALNSGWNFPPVG